MQYLSSLSSAVLSASTTAFGGGSSIPGLPAYNLGERVHAFEGRSIWSLYEGTKKDDSTSVSIFCFDSAAAPSSNYSNNTDRRLCLPLAKNALKKLRTLRHPNILRLLDGSESDTAVWIVTEPVTSLAVALDEAGGVSEESKVYGLLHLVTALSFLNKEGATVHGNVRHEAIWLTPGGDWKLGGMEICTKLDDDTGILWSHGSNLPGSRTYNSPEVRKGGWYALKECDAASYDSYQLHLILYSLFNGLLDSAFSQSSDILPALPNIRGAMPVAIFAAWRRLGNPNHRPRLKTTGFLELGLAAEGGWWPSNRLVKLSTALEGFSLASESERNTLIRTLKEVDSQKGAKALPEAFLKYKILPSLVQAFEFGGGGPTLLPLILSLAEPLPAAEYSTSIIQPLIRMFATPDRAMRMALLEGLDKFADKLTNKEVNDRVWPHLQTGFGDVVPVIREATVKSILLIAPKLSDRILNNDLLRLLAKTQTDPEAGIRTNTCILLGRLSVHLQPMTNRKVLVPAFARALRDPFVHARIAGLMALMATADCFEKEDLAGKVIPAMSICLVDRERAVRDQGYKAIEMFIRKCEALTANMPDVEVIESNGLQSGVGGGQQQQQQRQQAAAQNLPGVALNAAGAAGALAGWAFASVTKKLSAADLEAPINHGLSAAPSRPIPSRPVHIHNGLNGSQPMAAQVHQIGTRPTNGSRTSSATSLPGSFSLSGSTAGETDDWGGDLMNVNDDDDDWDGFESGQPVALRVDPLASRLSSSKAAKPVKKASAMKLATKSSALRIPMDLDAVDNWDIEEQIAAKPKPVIKRTPIAPKPIPKPVLAKTVAPIVVRPVVAPVVKAAPVIVSPPMLAPVPIPIPRPPPPSVVIAPVVAAVPRPPVKVSPVSPRAVVVKPAITARPPVKISPVSPPSPPPAVISPLDDEGWGGFDDDMPSASKPVVAAKTGMGEVTKQDKATKLAAMREERRVRMAKAKEGK